MRGPDRTKIRTVVGAHEQADTWGAVAEALAEYEGPDGFVSPAELIACTGTTD
ncbi:hypothetical protein [uncultured Ilumatobacter sp.]|uniref:hypothetical protein n=1 Tax=uncultured Ilumatobacter sp. TaxID=879968 RepID=UPI00374F562F